MGLVNYGPDGLVFEGRITPRDLDDLEEAFATLRYSAVEEPTVDFAGVEYIPSRAIGHLVALWVDLSEQGRRFELLVSDRVRGVLDNTGVAAVFFGKP
ncbi:MAG: STAS domain-containing protein [Planctomycetota bacterium]|jgi:anti-anti-sigma regulatory factor